MFGNKVEAWNDSGAVGSEEGAPGKCWAVSVAPEARKEWVEGTRKIPRVSPLHPSGFEQCMHCFGCLLHLVLYPLSLVMMVLEVNFLHLPFCPVFTAMIPMINPLLTFFLPADIVLLLVRPLTGPIKMPGISVFPLAFLSRLLPRFGARVAYAAFGSAAKLSWAYGEVNGGDFEGCAMGACPSGIHMDPKGVDSRYCCGVLPEHPCRTRIMAEFLRVAFRSEATSWDGDLVPTGKPFDRKSTTWDEVATKYACSGLDRCFMHDEIVSGKMFLQALAGWGQVGAEAAYDAAEVNPRLRTWIRESVLPTVAEDDRLHAWVARFVHGPNAFVPTELPAYWKNQDSSRDFFELCEPTFPVLMEIQKVLDVTFLGRRTRDREGNMPKRLKLIKAHRVENRTIWGNYCQLKQKFWEFADDLAEQDLFDERPVRTMMAFGVDLRDRLDPEVNEFYLLHGTTPAGAMGIAQYGFNVDLAGKRVGTMFGPGAYFAEASSKSDEYAGDDTEGVYSKLYAALLCRVLCGRIKRIENPDEVDAARASRPNTILGDREKARGTYREFVVQEGSQVYPEYIIIYDREYR